LACEAQDAQTGAVTLLGMRPGLEDQSRELGRAWADCRRIAKDPFDGPLGIAPMRARHVLGDGGVAAPPGAAQVHGDTLTFAEQLDGVSGDARIELLLDEPIRHRIVVSVDVDMVVEADPPDPPLGVFKGLVRQWLQRRAVELEEEISAADAQAAHRPCIEIGDEFGDRLVQLGE